MKNFSKNIILWIVIGLLLIALFNLFQNNTSTNSNSEISFSDFLIAADNGNISEVKIIGNNVTKNLPDGGTAGAIIGGILGLQNEQNAGGSYQTRCTTRTSYTESQKNVYSHSTITFTDSTGTRRTIKYYK